MTTELYLVITVICLLSLKLYKGWRGQYTCELAGAFFFAAALLCDLPPFDAEILVYFFANLILLVALLAIKAHKYLIYTAFAGLIAHISGRVFYITDYADYLILYNDSIIALNGIFVVLLVCLSDDGSIRLNRVGDTIKNYVARLVGD